MQFVFVLTILSRMHGGRRVAVRRRGGQMEIGSTAIPVSFGQRFGCSEWSREVAETDSMSQILVSAVLSTVGEAGKTALASGVEAVAPRVAERCLTSRRTPGEVLLEVFRDFEIHGEQSKLTTFLSQFVKALPHRWKRDITREKEIRQLFNDGRQFVFRIAANDQRPGATLFVLRRGSTLRVANVVPTEVGQLSKRQYNSYIEEFSRIASPIAQRLGLQAKITSDQRDIRDLLTTEAFEALQAFSVAANKSTGSSHPSDRRRWLAFLVHEHIGGRRLDTDTLQRWLIEEEKWPETEAYDLASEFEFARALLSTYDTERV
jgi:hypothetical protein